MDAYNVCVMGVSLLICALSWRSAVTERNKYKDQRDALLNLLDSEGRGKEALEEIKWYR